VRIFGDRFMRGVLKSPDVLCLSFEAANVGRIRRYYRSSWSSRHDLARLLAIQDFRKAVDHFAVINFRAIPATVAEPLPEKS
jgi:hypothetical protein